MSMLPYRSSLNIFLGKNMVLVETSNQSNFVVHYLWLAAVKIIINFLS